MNAFEIVSVVLSVVTLFSLAAMFFYFKKAFKGGDKNAELGSRIDSNTKLIIELSKSYNESLIKTVEILTDNVTRELKSSGESTSLKLSEINLTVGEKLAESLDKRVANSFNVINEQLKNVSEGLGKMKDLSKGVDSLQSVLANVKTRGIWGEVALESLLEQMLSPSQYAKQVKIENGFVDFAVVMPGQDGRTVLLPIDCKFPLEDYMRLVDASERNDRAETELSKKALISRIKSFAKDIGKKYIHIPKTTDFAIMYLPIEGLFAEAVKDIGLTDEIQRVSRVMLCGPTNLSALLSSLQMGFKTLMIQERSKEVWETLQDFKRQFYNFAGLLSQTEQRIDKVSEIIKKATRSTGRIEKTLKNVELPEGYNIPLLETDDENDF